LNLIFSVLFYLLNIILWKFVAFLKIFIMIQPQTYLNVADNTGAQKLMCIKILGSNRKYANIGDIIIAVVKL